METSNIILIVAILVVIVILCLSIFKKPEGAKETLFISGLLFIPRIIGNLMSALTMDDKGFSLKKCLAVYGTIVAGKTTHDHACKENAIAFVIIWLVWVGILVGIYSLGDISKAFSEIKSAKGKDEIIPEQKSPVPEGEEKK